MEENNPTTTEDTYALLDSGGGRMLEKLGGIITSRQCHHAWWRRKLPASQWKKAVEMRRDAKELMRVRVGAFQFQTHGIIKPLAPELREHWERASTLCAVFAEKQRRPARVLNLFAGEGGFTLAAAQAGASVTHVEGVSDAVNRARENAALNPLANKAIRWVIDDPAKFAVRERTQTTRHDLIVLDPREPREGKGGFDIERDLSALLGVVSGLLSDTPLGVFLFLRQGSVSPTTLLHLMRHDFSVFGGAFDHGELLLRGAEGVLPVPCGAYCSWVKKP